jgi:hypothetical protein
MFKAGARTQRPAGTSQFLHYAETADGLRAQWSDWHGEEVLRTGTLASRSRPAVTHRGLPISRSHNTSDDGVRSSPWCGSLTGQLPSGQSVTAITGQ